MVLESPSTYLYFIYSIRKVALLNLESFKDAYFYCFLVHNKFLFLFSVAFFLIWETIVYKQFLGYENTSKR